MSADNDFDFLSEWLDKAPHKPDCTNVYAAVACSCGLDEARKALVGIGPIDDYQCPGDCSYGDDLGLIRSKLEDMIVSKEWATMTREFVKETIRKIIS